MGSKKKMRMTGQTLRLAAGLIEAPVTGPLMYRVLIKQLGLPRLRSLKIPGETPPYRHFHLGRADAQHKENSGD